MPEWSRESETGRFAIDARSLAAFRIGLGVCVLLDVGLRFQDVGAHYTDNGILPRSAVLDLFPWLHSMPFCVHLISGNQVGQYALFVVHALSAVALLLGFHSHVAAVVAWLLTSSVQLRNLIIGGGFDALLRMLLFWAMFVPLDIRWAHTLADRPRAIVRTAGTAALLVQGSLMLWMAGYNKWAQPAWQDRSALQLILSDESRATWFASLLLPFPRILSFGSTAVVWLELLAPLVLLLAPPRWGILRLLTLGTCGLAFLLFGLSLRVGIFPLVAVVSLAPFLPGEFWNGLGRRWPCFRAVPPPPWNDPAKRIPTSIAQCACMLLLGYVVVWNFAVGRNPTFTDPTPVAPLGQLLFLQQDWRMFARPATKTGYVVIPATLADGSVVDFLAAGGPLPFGSQTAVSWDRPSAPGARFRDTRWLSLFMRGVYDPGGPNLARYASYACSAWNVRNKGPGRLAELEIFFMARPTADPPVCRFL